MKFVPFHVLAGTLAIVAGFIALYSVKGLKLHRKSGMVFVLAMLVMSVSGTIMVLVTMAYWLWRYRRKRSSRDVAGVSALEAI